MDQSICIVAQINVCPCVELFMIIIMYIISLLYYDPIANIISSKVL